MKTMLLTILIAATVTSASGVPIAQWTFEANTPADLVNSTASPSVAADLGIGTASGFHASAATDWSTPAGNGSANSFSANTWAVGDYWQFQVSTIGYENLAVSWDQVSSATGPGTFGFFWSLTGSSGSFTQVGGNYAVPQPTSGPWGSYSLDLSSIVSLNNDADVFFRLVDMSTLNAAGTASVVAGGTSRADNFTVSGTAIPSVPDSLPSGFAAAALLVVLGLGHRFARFAPRTA